MELIAFEKAKKLISRFYQTNETYGSIENFCVVTVQSYYCENLEEQFKALMAV